MMKILGSEFLWDLSGDLGDALASQAERLLSPDKRKSDQPLRRFTIREMSDLCLGIKYNTLRHYLKTIEDLPEGEMEPGNRKTYSLEEIYIIQQRLYDLGKIPLNLWPKRLDGEGTTKLLVYNLKGGVGKTSTSSNLAQFLAARGFRVLLVDLDPQASCSDLFDITADMDNQPSIYDVIKYGNGSNEDEPISITEVIQATYFPNIDIVPGSLNLTEFEYETARAAAGGQPFYSRISDALEIVEDSYDVILFDTPPHMSFAVIAALYASTAMLIPLSAGMLDVVSLVKFMELAANTLDQIEGDNKDDARRYDFIRVLLTRYSPNDSAQLQLASFLRNTLGDAMMGTDFLSSTAIADAGNTMNPLLEIEPSSFTRKTYERIFESLHGIALQVEEDIMISRGRIVKDEEAS